MYSVLDTATIVGSLVNGRTQAYTKEGCFRAYAVRKSKPSPGSDRAQTGLRPGSARAQKIGSGSL